MPKYNPATIQEYYDKIGMKDAYQRLAGSGIAEFISVVGVDPDFIFIENIIDENNIVSFSSVSMMSKGIYSEMSLSENGRSLFVHKIPKTIDGVIIDYVRNASYGKYEESSRILIKLTNAMSVAIHLNAAGANCEDLMELVKSYIMPHVIV